MKREEKEEFLSNIRKDAEEIFRVILKEGGSKESDQMIVRLVRKVKEFRDPIKVSDLHGERTDYIGSFLTGVLLGWAIRKKYPEY
jgi:hypothetical protein